LRVRQPPIFLGTTARADLERICNRVTLRATVPVLVATLRLILGRRGLYLGPEIVPLPDRPPWFRISLSSYVVLARPMTGGELAIHGSLSPVGFVIARIVRQGELLASIAELPRQS
jgi:hypothetical protein